MENKKTSYKTYLFIALIWAFCFFVNIRAEKHFLAFLDGLLVFIYSYMAYKYKRNK